MHCVGSAGLDPGPSPQPSGPPRLRPSWKRRMHDTALFGAEVSAARDLRWAQLLLALSVVLIAAASVQLLDGVFARLMAKGWAAADNVLFFLACTVLLFGNLVHQLVRFGLAQRLAGARPEAAVEASPVRANGPAPLVTILVPAYKE